MRVICATKLQGSIPGRRSRRMYKYNLYPCVCCWSNLSVGGLFVTEDEHIAVGRVDGCDARRRDRVCVRPPAQHVAAVQLSRAGPQSADHAVIRAFRSHGVSNLNYQSYSQRFSSRLATHNLNYNMYLYCHCCH